MLILLSCVLVVGGVLSISNARKQLDSIGKVDVEKTQIGNGMVDANSSTLIAMDTLAMVTRPELNPPTLAKIKTSRLRYKAFRKQLNKFPADSKSTVQLRADIDAAQNAAHKINDEVIALGMADRNAEAQTLRAKARGLQFTNTVALFKIEQSAANTVQVVAALSPAPNALSYRSVLPPGKQRQVEVPQLPAK